MAASATLDSSEKQCCPRRTDGEELKNSLRPYRRGAPSVALFFGAIKGRRGLRPGGLVYYFRLGI